MPSYKLVYFNSRGRAEPCRWLFALASQEYEDIRLEDSDWPKYKPKSPFGMVPYLEVDGFQIGQSIAITRFLGDEFGFSPKSNHDRARGDMVAETAADLMVPLVVLHDEKDEEKKKALLNTYTTEKGPALFAAFEKVLKQNNSGDTYFVGDKVTWVDLYFVTHATMVTSFLKTVGVELDMSPYPKVSALISRVTELPAIKAWIAKRPVTTY